MRVLVVGPFPPMPIAEADHVCHLCERLAARGVGVDVITSQGGETPEIPGVAVHRLIRDWSWPDLQPLLKRAQDCSPDAILLFYLHLLYGTHPMMRFLPTLARAALPGRPFVTMFTNAYRFNPSDFPCFRVFIQRDGVEESIGPADRAYQYGTLLRDSDRVIVLCDRILGRLSPFWPALIGKTILLPPPPILRLSPEDGSQVRQGRRLQLGLKPDHFLFAYFGYIYPGKGVETLLRAFQLINSRRPQSRLLLIGGSLRMSYYPTYTEDVLALARQLGLEGKVHWTGPYSSSSDEGSRHLRAADACVLPFDQGIALNNSSLAGVVAHELPVITTRGPSLESPFVHGENLWLCPPRDPEALALAMEQVMEDPKLLLRLQAGARQLSREWFSWERNLETLMAAFQGPCQAPDARVLDMRWQPEP